MDFFKKSKFGVIICSLFTACIMLSFLFWGLHTEVYFGDEGYMALCCKNWLISPLAILTFFQGHLWTSLFGEQAIVLRVLARLSQLLAVLIGCWYLYNQSKNIFLTSAVGLLALMASYLANHQIYNWDNGPFPSEALFTVLLMLYIAKPSFKRVIFLGMACGLMICYRLPLAFGAVIALAAIIACRTSEQHSIKNIFIDSLIGLASMIGLITILLLIICGNFTQIIESYSPNNFITGHGSLIRLLIPPLSRIYLILPSIILSTTIGFLAFMTAALFSSYKKISVWLNIAVVTLLCILAMSILYSYLCAGLKLMPGFGIPLFLCTLLFVPVLNALKRDNNEKEISRNKIFNLQLLFLFLCFLLPLIGSDTWFERFSVCYALPVAFALVWPKIGSRSKRLFILFLAYSALPLSILIPSKVYMFRQRGDATNIVNWGNKVGTTELSDQLNHIAPFALSLRNNSISYTIWGQAERFMLIYALENLKDNNGLSYPLHCFYTPDVVDKNLDFLSNNEVIIIPNYTKDEFPKSIDYLKTKYGYEECDFKGVFTLLVTPKKLNKVKTLLQG